MCRIFQENFIVIFEKKYQKSIIWVTFSRFLGKKKDKQTKEIIVANTNKIENTCILEKPIK